MLQICKQCSNTMEASKAGEGLEKVSYFNNIVFVLYGGSCRVYTVRVDHHWG